MVYIPNKRSDKIEEGAADRINAILEMFNRKMITWDLENSYWLVRRLRGNVFRKLGTKEREQSKELLTDLETKRKEYSKDINNKEKKAKFFEALEEYEIFLTANLGGITSLSEDLDDDEEE